MMKSIEKLQSQALEQIQANSFSKAIECLHEALKLDANNPSLHNNLGNAYKKIHDLEKAEAHYSKALALNPDYVEAHANLANLYAFKSKAKDSKDLTKKYYQQALKHYKAALDLAPDFTQAHFNLALLLIQNQEEAAHRCFKNVLALNPGHQQALIYHGIYSLKKDDIKEAKAAFLHVLTQDKEELQALNNLGIIALKENEPQRAIDYFTQTLALDNDHLEARSNLAATFMHYDRFENALIHYEPLLKIEPKNPEYLYNSGVAQMALGHLKEAEEFFLKVLKEIPQHFAALNNLAAIALRLGDKIKAQTLLQQALVANPDDKPSQHMLKALNSAEGITKTCPEYAKNLFNNYALYYDRHLQTTLKYTLPEEIFHLCHELNLKGFALSLDLGCGTGLVVEKLKELSQAWIGLDIAPKMLAQAKAKGLYQSLHEANALDFFHQTKESYDLIVAADLLPYFADLNDLFQGIHQHLKPQGYFIFSTEISETQPWYLQTNARFSHNKDYLEQLAKNLGFEEKKQKTVVARQQEGQEVKVYLCAWKKI